MRFIPTDSLRHVPLCVCVGRVDEEKQKTMDKVRYEFNQFDIALKHRLQDLIANVEGEVGLSR